MAGDVDFKKIPKDVEIKDDKILLEWYDAMLQQGEMDNIPGGSMEPRPMEIEIKAKDEGEEKTGDDIKNIEHWAEIHKAKAFAKALMSKLETLSPDTPTEVSEENKNKCKAEIKALASKIVEIVNGK
jgi:ABC-type Zn2+ transport system substrate-binding protein/surface adhesin